VAEIFIDRPADLAAGSVASTQAGPARAQRAALRVLQAGAIAVMLAAATWKQYELDRFFVPKELVLHLAAMSAGALLLGAVRHVRSTRVDLLLGLYLALAVVSTALATNPWLGFRALAISASGIILFLAARAIGDAGLERPLIAGLALAVVIGTVTALLQTYGVRTDFFSLNRSPGGTFGNRNFVAHLAAFGLPVVLLAALRARHVGGFALGALGTVLVVASLILTRSRAGWLAFGGVVAVFMLALVLVRPLRRDLRTWLRIAGILVFAAAGVAAALSLPNTLRWRSDNPYLDSVRGVANYQEGSGRGRLIQYRHSLGMTADRPLLGAGPGNWAVVYPDHAAAGDPSLDRTAAGMTSNPWPSSDWVAFVSERGLPAALLLILAFTGIAFGALRRLRDAAEAERALADTALLATLAATTIAGAFDAVLLLAAPTFIVWTVLGSLHRTDTAQPPERGLAGRRIAFIAILLVALGGVLRSAAQLTAMGLHAAGDTALLRTAARIDPGNYRVHMQLARSGGRDQRCRHADAAHRLYPHARAPRPLTRGCG
jgi:O-antigen ligase